MFASKISFVYVVFLLTLGTPYQTKASEDSIEYVPPIFQTLDSLQTSNEFQRELNDIGSSTTSSPTESPAPSPSPSAVPTGSPTITPKPTDQPTSSPTESPAPSPSPSATPTASPSGSPSSRPSQSPTYEPSSQPSQSPSDEPSSQPSAKPTGVPSSQPSHAPTGKPSSQPSLAPTGKPSSQPSFAPTGKPSSLPSFDPTGPPPTKTPSQAPSPNPSEPPAVQRAPTRQPSVDPTSPPSVESTVVLTNLREQFTTQINLSNQLSTQIEVASFTRGVSSFITSNKPSKGNVYNVLVTIAQQTTINGNTRGRRNLSMQLIEIKYDVEASYAGTDPNFSLSDTYGAALRNLDMGFVQKLAQAFDDLADPSQPNIYDHLLTNPSSINAGVDATNEGEGVTTTAKIFSGVFSVFAVALAVIASVYALRRYEGDQKRDIIPVNTSTEEEPDLQRIESDDRSFDAIEVAEKSDLEINKISKGQSAVIRFGQASYLVDVSSAIDTEEKVLASGKIVHRSKAKNSEDELALGDKKNGSQTSKQAVPDALRSIREASRRLSPSPPRTPRPQKHVASKRPGTVIMLDKATLSPENRNDEAIRTKKVSHETNRRPQDAPSDPPTSKAGDGNKGFQNSNEPTPRNREVSDITFADGERHPQHLQSNPTQVGGRGNRASMSIAQRIAQFEKLSETGSDSTNDVATNAALLGRIPNPLGMNLGSTSESQEGKSDLTSQAKAFISNMLVQAANVNQPQEKQSERKGTSEPFSRHAVKKSRKMSRYDVFAPSGAIGVVVDTTKNGPSVHSLKPTSPMLGLITPGDLIVALDGQDTTGMNAATLTRLMAKKSSQTERKITLMSIEE